MMRRSIDIPIPYGVSQPRYGVNTVVSDKLLEHSKAVDIKSMSTLRGFRIVKFSNRTWNSFNLRTDP